MSIPDTPPPRTPLRQQLRRAWTRVRGGDLTPTRASRSVGIGLFIGTLPLPGLHLPMVLGVCLPLRLDAALSYLAANISIPPIAPFLWIGSIQIGARILHGHYISLDRSGVRGLMSHGAGKLVGALALGSVLLAAALAVLGALLTWSWMRFRATRRAQSQDPFALAVTRTAKRYATATKSRGTYYYVRGKLNGDPSTRAVASLGGLGRVLDLGCGRGQLDVLLLEAGCATRVEGWDWDDAKLSLARTASHDLDATFTARDIRGPREAESPADTVLLIDALHYFRVEEQDAMLKEAAEAVAPGGRLVVRDADLGRGWRSKVTLLFERIGTAIRFNRGERVRFRHVENELVPQLNAWGFTCTVTPCWAGTPFSNVLLVAQRNSQNSEG